MEDGLADEPQEAVNTRPELAQITECLCSVFKKVQAIDTVSET